MKKLFILLFLFNLNYISAQTSYWKTVNLGIVSDLYGVNPRYAVGDNGKIFYTSNGGINWAQQQSNTSANLRSVASNTSYSTSLSVGAGGTVLRTTNNGLTWVLVNSGTPNNLYSVCFATVNYCYACGANGTIIRSTNAGLNWVVMNSGTSVNLNAISFGGSVFVCGNNGTVRMLTNVLDTIWKPRNTGSNILNSIYSNSGNVTAVGDNGIIYKSTNSGVNWQQLTSPTVNNLKSITNLWIVGGSGTVLTYDNSSNLWKVFPNIVATDLLGVCSVTAVLGNPFLYAVGKSGKLLTLQSDTSYFYSNLNGNNINARFCTRGIFDNNYIDNNDGFEWPKGSGKFAVYTAGITIAAYVNGGLRMSAASFKGEYTPGYCSQGILYQNSIFRIYRVTRGDNQNTNRDWAEWGLMVPYGAPFKDINNNGIYEPATDIPGVKDSKQTIFMCLTDADQYSHLVGEGFGGGTLPMGSEVHITAWCYDNPGYQDIQFFKWEIINKGIYPWNRTYFSILCHSNLGFAGDNYIGSDSVRSLAYVYNADNYDDSSSYENGYGLNPPAVGIVSLKCIPKTLPVTSIITFYSSSSTPGPSCEKEPNGQPLGAYNYMKGFKSDLTPWVVPNTNPPLTTKYCYSGDPESGNGWTEYKGKIANCGGSLYGNYTYPNNTYEKDFLISLGSDNLNVNVNDTVIVLGAQLIARGTNHLNSVTKLKQLTDRARQLCLNGFVIGINPISSEIPSKFNLYQNYPNPFNPVTKIKFDIPVETTRRVVSAKLIIYDATGREISTLLNEQLRPGIYEVDWNGTNYPSGVYFYMLQAGDFSETKKMVLLK